MIMELRWHAHVENHVIKVLIELKFKVVLLTFYRLRHEDFLLEGFGMKKIRDTFIEISITHSTRQRCDRWLKVIFFLTDVDRTEIIDVYVMHGPLRVRTNAYCGWIEACERCGPEDNQLIYLVWQCDYDS